MQTESNKQQSHYVLEATCGNFTLLFPLEMMKTILSKNDIQPSDKNKQCVIYEDVEYPFYSLSALFHRSPAKEELYAIVTQIEGKELIVYLEHIEMVRYLDKQVYALPSYMKIDNLNYLKGCYLLEDNRIAYEIDFTKLVERCYP